MNSGLNMQLFSRCKTSMKHYSLLFHEEVMDFIAGETDRCESAKDNAYISTGGITMQKFLALIIPMGYVHHPKLEDY